MKKATWFLALIVAAGIVLTGCAPKAAGQEASPNAEAGNPRETNALTGWCTPPPNITYDPVTVTDATPATLENTVWVFREETSKEQGVVLFFRDGVMTAVSADACYGAPYDYRDTQLTVSYQDIAISGEAIEGLLYFRTNKSGDGQERIAVWTTIEDAAQFAKELNGGFVAPFTPDDLGIVINTPAPSEDFSQTPESLDGTAWILEYDVGQVERAAFFFKDGMATVVSWDYIYEDSYTYENHILVTDEINIGFEGVVDGSRLTEVTFYGAPYPDLTRVDIPHAVQYAKELRPEFVSPFDGGGSEPDRDTVDSGAMNPSADGYKRFENALFSSEIPADWKVTTVQIQYMASTVEQPHNEGDLYCYFEVVCGPVSESVVQERYNGLVASNVNAALYDTTIAGQPAKVLERSGPGGCVREIFSATPAGEGYRMNFYCLNHDQTLDFSSIQEVMDHFIEHITFSSDVN